MSSLYSYLAHLLPRSAPTAPGTHRFEYKAVGVVVNVFVTPEEGHNMHIILQEGRVKKGDYFSAGGWVGSVTGVIMEDALIDAGTAGQGVKLRIKFKNQLPPIPSGDKVYIFDCSVSMAVIMLKMMHE